MEAMIQKQRKTNWKALRTAVPVTVSMGSLE